MIDKDNYNVTIELHGTTYIVHFTDWPNKPSVQRSAAELPQHVLTHLLKQPIQPAHSSTYQWACFFVTNNTVYPLEN